MKITVKLIENPFSEAEKNSSIYKTSHFTIELVAIKSSTNTKATRICPFEIWCHLQKIRKTHSSWRCHTWQDFDRLRFSLNVVESINNTHSIKWSLKECNFILHANDFDVEPAFVCSFIFLSLLLSISISVTFLIAYTWEIPCGFIQNKRHIHHDHKKGTFWNIPKFAYGSSQSGKCV